jgi:hypothetical protein
MWQDIPAVIAGSLSRAPWGWLLLLTVVLALIKVWPVIQLQTLKARAALRGEQREDLDDCKTRMDALDRKFNLAIAHIHQLDLKLVGTVGAYRILHDHMSQNHPDEQALSHAEAIFKTTWDGPIEPLGTFAS